MSCSGMQFVTLRNVICHAQECDLSCLGMQFVTLRNAIRHSGMRFVMLRNAICHSGMQLNILFTKSCIHLHKFIVLSAVAVLVVSLSRCQNGKSCDGSEEDRARSLA